MKTKFKNITEAGFNMGAHRMNLALVEKWYDKLPLIEKQLGKLGRKAAEDGFSEFYTFCDGDSDDQRKLARKYKIPEANKFLAEWFDDEGA